MEEDKVMIIEPREKQVDQQRCSHAGGNEMAVGLTSRLKIASRSSESFVKANPAQAIGAAVLTGGLALALYLFKKRKPPSNKCVHLPPASPQVLLEWHWESFKRKYTADDDDSCSASCYHLRVVQAVAKEKDKATCQELYRLGVLQFLVDEMKGHFAGPQLLHGAVQDCILPKRTTAGSQSPSPDRIPGRVNSLKSPGRNKPCQGHQQTRSNISVSPDRPLKNISRSFIPRVPIVSNMEEADSQAEAVDRGGNLHVPASAPTSSAHSSPQISARRALSLAHSPVANRSPVVSPSKQPLAALPPQSAPNHMQETASVSKQSAGPFRPARQSSGGFRDENRPVRGLGSPDSPRLGEFPAGFQPCGDLNEDVKQWEGHEKEHRPPDDDDSTTYSTDDPDSRATSPRASPCSWGPSSPCRVSPSSKPLRSRVSGIPPLSGQRSLAPSVMPGRLPATPLRQLQIASPNHELHQGRISRDPERHLMMVQLAVDMLLTGSGDLDPVYIKSMSEVQHLSVIQQHLSTDCNACMTEALESWAAQAGEPIMRLLRLTSRHLFNADQYRDRCQIARGAYSEVYTCSCYKQGKAAPQLALKVSDLPSESRQNEKAQITAFTEIGVMQRLEHMPGICKLHDYGINRQGIFLVMTRYSCSLRTWLAKQTVKPSLRLRLYMEIFCQLAELLTAVAEQEVVHFDLKCDNILLEALPGVLQQEFWAPSTDSPPFKLILADFGDSCDFSLAEQKFTTRSLGTESNQPPEMLVSKESGARKQFGKLPIVTGSSTPSDVWSLGCLLFELFTGNLLYPDSEDFSKFFSILTGMADEVLLSPERLQPVEHMPAVVDLLSFILVRNPNTRPTAGAVAERVKAILRTI